MFNTPCPCGSNKLYSICCGKLISGKENASSAEVLMRSRYSAYVKKKPHYIFRTASGKASEDLLVDSIIQPDVKWIKLIVHEVIGGDKHDDRGEVRFSAYYKIKKSANASLQVLHEHSVFKKIDQQWFYVGSKD